MASFRARLFERTKTNRAAASMRRQSGVAAASRRHIFNANGILPLAFD